MPVFRQLDVTRQPGRGDGTVRAALWLTVTQLNWQAHSHRESERWMEKRYGDWLLMARGSFFTYQDVCVKHYSLLLCLFSCQPSRNLSFFALLSRFALLRSNCGQFIQEKDLRSGLNLKEMLFLSLFFLFNFKFSFISHLFGFPHFQKRAALLYQMLL